MEGVRAKEILTTAKFNQFLSKHLGVTPSSQEMTETPVGISGFFYEYQSLSMGHVDFI